MAKGKPNSEWVKDPYVIRCPQKSVDFLCADGKMRLGLGMP